MMRAFRARQFACAAAGRFQCFSTNNVVSDPSALRVMGGELVFAMSPERATSLIRVPGSGFAGAQRLGLIRDMFSPSCAERFTSVSQVLRSLSNRDVLIPAAVTNEPAQRKLVDEYILDEYTGEFVLSCQGHDLLRFLNDEGVRVHLAPDSKFFSSGKPLVSEVRQSTNEVLMLAPTAFESNSLTAQDNAFMNTKLNLARQALRQKVLGEYAGLYEVLSERFGVQVHLFSYEDHHGTPDACFPNNWFSTHVGEGNLRDGQGRLVLYPMKAENRRLERRADLISYLHSLGNYGELLDLTEAEEAADPKYFEGTGTLILDRPRGIAYVSTSQRAHPDLAREWVEKMGYNELVLFSATDKGVPVYHTNVLMGMGTSAAIVCLECIDDPKDRKHLVARLNATGKEIIDITRQQMGQLCGNVLELEDGRGLPILAMSTRSFNAFTPEQKKQIHRNFAGIAHAPIDTLEDVGGGGVRCALAELM
eukprot:jgi/Mesvir1/2258/Mv19306-RA.1